MKQVGKNPINTTRLPTGVFTRLPPPMTQTQWRPNVPRSLPDKLTKPQSMKKIAPAPIPRLPTDLPTVMYAQQAPATLHGKIAQRLGKRGDPNGHLPFFQIRRELQIRWPGPSRTTAPLAHRLTKTGIVMPQRPFPQTHTVRSLPRPPEPPLNRAELRRLGIVRPGAVIRQRPPRRSREHLHPPPPPIKHATRRPREQQLTRDVLLRSNA